MLDFMIVSGLMLSSVMLSKFFGIFGGIPAEVIDAIIIVFSYLFGLISGKGYKKKKDKNEDRGNREENHS